MNILLMNEPPILEDVDYSLRIFTPPIGITYLATSLLNSSLDCNVEVLDCWINRLSLEDVKRKFLQYNPDLVGISIYTQNVYSAKITAELFKKLNPKIKIVVGGPHICALPEQTLSEFDCFDFGISGEGEDAIVKLCRAVSNKDDDLSGIDGLFYRNGKEIVNNGTFARPEQLDDLKFPEWEKFNLDSYRAPIINSGTHGRVLPILTSRGCPYECIFCQRPYGNAVRYRSIENVLAELQQDITKFKATAFCFQDETFTLSSERVTEICKRIIKDRMHHYIIWHCFARADKTDFSLYKLMREAGCRWITLGVESGNQRILNRLKKGIDLNTIFEAVKKIKMAGIKLNCTFILGCPQETKDTIKDTINFALKLNPTVASFGLMVPYPGTQVYKMAKSGEGGYRLIEKNWSNFGRQIGGVLELNGLGLSGLIKLQVFAYLRFYLRINRLFNLYYFFTFKGLIRYIKYLFKFFSKKIFGCHL